MFAVLRPTEDYFLRLSNRRRGAVQPRHWLPHPWLEPMCDIIEKRHVILHQIGVPMACFPTRKMQSCCVTWLVVCSSSMIGKLMLSTAVCY